MIAAVLTMRVPVVDVVVPRIATCMAPLLWISGSAFDVCWNRTTFPVPLVTLLHRVGKLIIPPRGTPGSRTPQVHLTLVNVEGTILSKTNPHAASVLV